MFIFAGVYHDHTPKVTSHNLPTPSNSSVFVPITVPVDTVKTTLEQQAKTRPIADGRTAPINGTYATEFVINKIRVKTILQAAHDEKITSTRSVITAILTGGTSIVVEETINHIPEMSKIEDVIDTGQTITGTIINRFSEPVSKLVDARYVVHYKCNFGNIESLSIVGDKLYATLVFNWNINADLLTPFP